MDSKTLISITFRTNPFFSEILTDDIESAEVAVEGALSPILMELFGGNIVTENVSVEYVDKANISKAASADRTQTIKMQVETKPYATHLTEAEKTLPQSKGHQETAPIENLKKSIADTVSQTLSKTFRKVEVESVDVSRATQVSSSTIRIRIIEDPLTAQNLNTIISVLTDLHTKCWLIEQGRFSDLIEYTQTRNIRFTKEANLMIGRLTRKSPTLIDLLITSGSIAGVATLALALKIAIDAVVQTPLRFKATKLENQKKELEMRLEEEEAQQVRHIAAQKAELEKNEQEQARQIIAQKAELEKQKTLLEIAKQKLEIREQLLEVQEKGLEVEKKRIGIALETAGKMVDTLRPGIDMATKGMLVQPLLPSLLQLGNAEGLELVDNEEEVSKDE